MKKDRGMLIDKDFDLLLQVKRDSSGKITQGLVVGNTLEQNQAIILLAQKGEIKEQPMLGVGILDSVNDNDILQWKQEIIDNFDLDGLEVKKIDIDSNFKIHIDARYR